jgi:glyoxylate/hydroxypyruvate reductase A
MIDASAAPLPAKRPVLLFACFGVNQELWLRWLRHHGPDIEIRVWPQIGLASEIDYVLAWEVPDGFWAQFGALKAIFSLGAGVERLLLDKDIPVGVEIVRMEDPSLEPAMAEYVLLHVLHHHRDMGRYAADQRQRLWRPAASPLASERTVGILGLGRLGRACAELLVTLGFDVRGWSRTANPMSGVTAFVGPGELDDFLSRCEVLVCTLALTPQTRGILDLALFRRLPKGALLINVGRGGHLNEPDLTTALDEGCLAGAVLDVLSAEPPPQDHPFWSDPRIAITPHISAPTRPQTAAQTVIAKIDRIERSAPVSGVVNRSQGY